MKFLKQRGHKTDQFGATHASLTSFN